MVLFVQTVRNRRQRRTERRREREFISSTALNRVLNVILLTTMHVMAAATEIVNFIEQHVWLLIDRWEIQKCCARRGRLNFSDGLYLFIFEWDNLFLAFCLI